MRTDTGSNTSETSWLRIHTLVSLDRNEATGDTEKSDDAVGGDVITAADSLPLPLFLDAQDTQVKSQKKSDEHGKVEYSVMMQRKHREFLYGVLAECAKRLSGALVILSRNDGFGDSSFTSYAWRRMNLLNWIRYRRPPVFLHELPAGVDLLPIAYHTRHLEHAYVSPMLTSAELCKINARSEKRLLLWDLGSADTTMIAAIPSGDVRATEAQGGVFLSNFGLK